MESKLGNALQRASREEPGSDWIQSRRIACPGYYMSRLQREDAGTMPALPALTSVKRRTRAFALPVTPDCFLAGSPTRDNNP